MTIKSPLIPAFAIATAALLASAPARADSCNQDTHVYGDGNYIVNNCTIVKRSAPDYNIETDYDLPSPSYTYPAPVYRPVVAPMLRPWPYMYGPRVFVRPFFAGGFHR